MSTAGGAPAAGYSATPLARKLGIKADGRVLVVGGPPDLALTPLEPGVTVTSRPRPPGLTAAAAAGAGDRYDVVLLFCPDRAMLERSFDLLVPRLEPASSFWVCWPKKASKVATDLTEQLVREHGLAGGLVDVKIAAVDTTWSALKFVYRLADRPR